MLVLLLMMVVLIVFTDGTGTSEIFFEKYEIIFIRDVPVMVEIYFLKQELVYLVGPKDLDVVE